MSGVSEQQGSGDPILVVDVGNTNICLGVTRNRGLVASWRIRTDPDQTKDEFGIVLAQLMATLEHRDDASIRGAVVACVVPPLADAIVEGIASRFRVPVLVVGPGLRTGISIRTDNPREVGADRIVNAVAARELAPGGAIIVDMGTATTFDCVSPAGEYLGGAIAPGLHVSAEALVRRTAKLPKVQIVRPARALGRNTEQSMQSGLFFGYVSLIDGLVDRLRAELDFDPQIIATGGLAEILARSSRTLQRVEPDLTLTGLAILWERNRE